MTLFHKIVRLFGRVRKSSGQSKTTTTTTKTTEEIEKGLANVDLDLLKKIDANDLQKYLEDNWRSKLSILYDAFRLRRMSVIEYLQSIDVSFIDVSGRIDFLAERHQDLYSKTECIDIAVNCGSPSILGQVVRRESPDTLCYLLDNYPRLDNISSNYVYWEVFHERRIEILKYLTERYRDRINEKDLSGFSLLELAIRFDDVNVVNNLLEAGADPAIECRNGADNPIHLAVKNLDIVKDLVIHGANIEAKGTFGLRPIHCAVICGCVEVVEFLISCGVDTSALLPSEREEEACDVSDTIIWQHLSQHLPEESRDRIMSLLAIV